MNERFAPEVNKKWLGSSEEDEMEKFHFSRERGGVYEWGNYRTGGFAGIK